MISTNLDTGEIIFNKSNENPFINLILNIVLPSFILIKLSGAEYLGSVKSLILALSFPILYGIYGLIKNKKVNFFSIINIVKPFQRL